MVVQFKLSFMHHPSRSMEERNFNCGNPDQRRKWPRDNSYYIVSKSMLALFPSSKTQLEAKINSFRLMALAEQISRCHNVDSAL